MPEGASKNITIRPMEERDLNDADRVMRLAFGTFLGLPDPMAFMGDASYIPTRWKADPTAAVVAEVNGEVVGSCLATGWGSVGFFGPLTVRPDYWDKGVAQALLEATMGIFHRWGIDVAGLFTFPHSTKHIHLYQKFGFWPQYLTSLMNKAVASPDSHADWSKFSTASNDERTMLLDSCRRLADEIYPGLDLEREVRAAADQKLGETVLLWDKGELVGLAVCHCGPGSEAGSGTCYIKFGAVRPSDGAGEHFGKLLDACEALADEAGLAKLFAGNNMCNPDAYRTMLKKGFRAGMNGVIMQRENKTGYRRPEAYVIDDWR